MSDSFDVEITAMGGRAEGLAMRAGERIFVPFALPGEKLRVLASDGRARIEAILAPSPDRIASFCPHFTLCGGCQLQHWRPEPYRQWKRELVVDALSRAGLDVPIAELVDAHGQGRRRVTFHATSETAGFSGWKSHDIHPIDMCPILVPALAAAPQIAADIGRLLGKCDVAITATDTGLDVAIRTKSRGKPNLAPLASKHDLARLSRDGEILSLRRQPNLQIGLAPVDLPVDGFLQPTSAGETALSALVVEGVGKAKRVADLFSGVGPFALRVAEFAQTFAADSHGAAIAALDKAMQATPGLKRLGAETRDLVRDPLLAAELARFDAVIFDPPRAGAEAQARELAKSKVKRIVAVSCDPHTFSRDAAILTAGGYTLEKVTPLDQFRYTSHVECVGMFKR